MPDELLSTDPQAGLARDDGFLSADPSAGAPTEGVGAMLKRWATTPITDYLERGANAVSNWIDPDDPVTGRATGGLRGVTSAMIESLGKTATDSLLTPTNALLTVGGFGGLGRGVQQGLRVLGGVQAAHGAKELYEGDTGKGAVDLVLGGLSALPGGGPKVRVATTAEDALLPMVNGERQFTGMGAKVPAPAAVGWKELPAPTGKGYAPAPETPPPASGPLPMVNGERQFTGFGPGSAFNREAARLGEAYAGLSHEPEAVAPSPFLPSGVASGGEVDPLDPRFFGRERVLQSYPSEPTPFVHAGDNPGSSIDALDPRFVGRDRMPTSYEPEPVEPSPFTRSEASGGDVDPLDPRFAARPQGTAGGEFLSADPFASSLDHATQPSFGEAPVEGPASSPAPPPTDPLEALLHEFEQGHAAVEPLDTPAAPIVNNGSGESAASIEALSRQRGMADRGETFVKYDRAGQRTPLIGPDAVDYHVQPGETYGVEGPNGFQTLDDAGGRPPTATTNDPLRRFFRFDEAPTSPSGQRRLSADEVTRARGMQDTNLGEPVAMPGTPSAFKPMPSDPAVEWLTRGGRYADLPASQRRLAIANDEHFAHLLGDESGFVDPQAIAAGLPKVADAANRLRYFSMLSSPVTQIKNVAGNVGAVASHAAESALGGQFREAGDVLREFFSPQTVRDAIAEYRAPSEGGRWGNEGHDVLDIPGRTMGAIDRATKNALERGNVPADRAHEITFTNRPKSDLGSSLNDALNRSTAGKLLVPFSKTATNILERGIERTPGLGYLAQALSGGNLTTSVPKQILGAVAAGAGGYVGSRPGAAAYAKAHPTQKALIEALLGPYAVPYAIGSGAMQAAQKPKSTAADVVQAALSTLSSAAPMPNEYTLDPSRYLASYVPNILRDVNPLAGIDPAGFDVGHSFVNRSIAKVPVLNELLLHKSKVRHAPSAR